MGSQRTKREQRWHLVPLADAMAPCVLCSSSARVPKVASVAYFLRWSLRLRPKKFGELLFLSVGAGFFVSLRLSGLPRPPSVLHLKLWSYKLPPFICSIAHQGLQAHCSAKKCNTINANSTVRWQQQKHNFLFITLLLPRHHPWWCITSHVFSSVAI